MSLYSAVNAALKRDSSGKNAKFNEKLVTRFAFLSSVAKEQHSSQTFSVLSLLRACPCVRVPGQTPTPRQQFAHDVTLHLLTRLQQYPLREAERADLIQNIEGYTIPHDREAAGRWD